jgi:glucosamine kinase
MLTKDFYIGVDGGGTKSKAYIEDVDGNAIGTAIGGPANIRLSVETSWESIYSAISKALSGTGILLEDKNYRFHIGLGLAGVEVPADRERFLAQPHPFTSLRLESDAYAACLGAHNNHDGAIIIIGTGINGFQIQHGKTLQVSGWGFPHDDIGGGAWLGLQATSLTLQWLDGRLDNASPLLEAIYHYFNQDMTYLVSWANAANSTQFAKLAPLVIEYVEKKDLHALQLIKTAANAINAVNQALQKRAIDKTEKLPVCLFGGVAPFIRPWLDEALQARLVERTHDASVGAVFMIRNLLR